MGSFGQIRLAVHKPTSTPYALKTMYKGQIIAMNQVEHVLSEKRVMGMCSHPFIVRLAATYQDADCLYMLIELVQGGELFNLLRSQQVFKDAIAA